MNIIVNVDKNWAIGNKGSLLFPISADLKNFRRLTEHRVVIMGRTTLASLPGGMPLKNRHTIVLSTTLEESQLPFTAENSTITVCRSVAQLQHIMNTPPFSAFASDDFFVIGGQQVYAQLLPLCSTAYITQVEKAASAADAFFPNLDADKNWHRTEKSPVQKQGELSYYFVQYQKTKQEGVCGVFCADTVL